MPGVVVGVDGSEGAEQALRWAVAEGGLHGWPVTALLAWGLLDQHHPQLERRFDPAYDEQSAQAALDAYVDASTTEAGGSAVDRRTTCDLPARALLEAGADADLVVVGGRGLGGFSGLLLGAVSNQVVRHAAGPVAVVHQGGSQHAKGGRVVVGVDGSDAARRALVWAVEEARVRNATLEVVHAWHVPAAGDPFGVVAVDPDLFEESATALLNEVVDGVDTSTLDLPVVRTLRLEGPSHAILGAAEGADLVVMGARGAGGFAGLLLGSATDQVVHHATCPVVIIPAGS